MAPITLKASSSVNHKELEDQPWETCLRRMRWEVEGSNGEPLRSWGLWWDTNEAMGATPGESIWVMWR